MNKIITILLLVLFFSCKKQKSEYPEIIIRHNLEEQYDLAKWELYKLNCVIENEYGTDFLIKIETDEDYKAFNKNYLLKDKQKIKEILGNENVIDFIECDLEWFGKIDSSRIFKDDEIHLTFFPKCNGDKNFSTKIGGLCYTIIFDPKEKVRYGCGDYLEWSYEKEIEEFYEKEFLKILKRKNKKIHPWILEYYQNYKK
ncbi:MAG: hypothetical protein AB8F94_00900 [Saprospiraceae bacterium]